eukprot:CAMPEP_0181126264 /NCGR_PEP_ID=MMETSP1071-20121207/27525_1 /TAXON_ID=35127 /ORGANISM="Thalassiosira sp., Strain NH16" /LENGTH=293 /DNA_ID=CAMNT_0023211831 /DNA_START=186 /DNA_END=1067 /DNA_ORIENTATION=-
MNLITSSSIVLLLLAASGSAATESGGKCGRPGGVGEATAIILLQKACGGGNSAARYTGVVECQSQEISYCQSYVSDRSKTKKYCARKDMSSLKSQCKEQFCKIAAPHGGGICGADQKDKEIKFLRSVSASETTRRSPADAGFEDGKQNIRKYWRKRLKSRCSDIGRLKKRANKMKKKDYPLGSDNWKTNVRNTSARTGVDQEVKKIEDSCSTPESPADAGFRAGKKAVDDYWRRNGSDCGNKFALHYRGEEIKKNKFPLGSDNWKTNVFNTSARTGVDQEVDRLWNRCNKAEA